MHKYGKHGIGLSSWIHDSPYFQYSSLLVDCNDNGTRFKDSDMEVSAGRLTEEMRNIYRYLREGFSVNIWPYMVFQARSNWTILYLYVVSVHFVNKAD